MNYIGAIIFGITQGITEFVPVSSSGHLLILHRFIDLPVNNELAFDVAVHFATLISLVIFFRRDILMLLKSWIYSFFGKKNAYSKLSWLLLIGTIPAGLAGFMFNDFIENKLRSPFVVIAALAVIGAAFIAAEKYCAKRDEMISLDCRKALLIGIAQSLALIPGTSRSGITIIAGLVTGLKREEAVRFSFLLSIPIVLGAGLKEMPEFLSADYAADEKGVLAIAFCAAFLSGLAAIKFLLNYSKNNGLKPFAYYRIILALVLLLLIF